MVAWRPWCCWAGLLMTFCVANNNSEMVPVKDPKKQIPEFLFECLDEPWIANCQNGNHFFMLIGESGNFFEEKINRTDSSHSLLKSLRKKAEKPSGGKIIDDPSYPSFLFEMELQDGSFYLISSSGKLLVADDQLIPELMLSKDHCSNSPRKDSSSSMISTETTKPALQTYICDQAKWTLWKADDMFLVIQSAFNETFSLSVSKRKSVILDVVKEKMTGIQSSFLLPESLGPLITLDKTAGKAPEAGIDSEAYGDVVLHYIDRNGNTQKGYVCDFDWGLKEAESVCRLLDYEAGIATYDGRYSQTTNPEYVVSGVQCEEEDLQECKFRTICGTNDPNCLTQQSMKPFKGNGYACNKGSKTDAAGVVCGNQTTINKMLQQELKCNRGTIDKDRLSVAKMSSVMSQVKQTGSKMFENQHWSEYLLPMPMAFSLMTTLLLVSSQYEHDVALSKPSSGQWNHLKYDWLQANLLFLSNNIAANFELSNSNMGVIKVNSRKVHENMKLVVPLAFSTDEYEKNVLLPRHLRYISEDAQDSKEKAEAVSLSFDITSKIIDELLEALTNTKSLHSGEKKELEMAIKYVKTQNEQVKKDLKVKEEEKDEFDKKVKISRKKFYDAAKKAMQARCVDGVTECTKCRYKAREKTGVCLEKVERCREHEKYCCNDKLGNT